jgi:N-acetylglucosamine-6-phosphate deacetylase
LTTISGYNSGCAVLRGGRVLREGREEPGLAVVVEGGRISGLGQAPERRARRRGLPCVDLAGAYLAPGFVDIHTHGAAGVDFFRASRDEFEEALSGHYPAHGVTALLVSLYPAPRPEFLEALRRVAGYLGDGVGRGIAAGIHLAGPFLSPAKPGALPRGAFRAASKRLARELLLAGGGKVRTQTIAPEIRGGLELVRLLRQSGVVPFVGHTACDQESARAAFRAGARGVTHLFNAMDGLHHRSPGPVAEALLDERVAVELIADGFHVAAEALKLVARVKPPEKICLISDSVAPAGLADGRYEFAGAPVRLARGRVTLPDGTLAGSALTMDRAFRLMVREAGVSAAAAAMMASKSPARAVGWKHFGDIAPGQRGNLVVLDDRLRVEATYLRGERIYSRR